MKQKMPLTLKPFVQGQTLPKMLEAIYTRQAKYFDVLMFHPTAWDVLNHM